MFFSICRNFILFWKAVHMMPEYDKLAKYHLFTLPRWTDPGARPVTHNRFNRGDEGGNNRYGVDNP